MAAKAISGEDVLDLAYCRQWISKLQLSSDADQVWHEGIPDKMPWQAVR